MKIPTKVATAALASTASSMSMSTTAATAAKSAAGTQRKVMVVTGSNTGLGQALVRGLLKKYCIPALDGSSSTTKHPTTTTTAKTPIVYLTARDEGRGKQAVEQLVKEEGLPSPAFHLLDVSKEESVIDFASHIQSTYGPNSIDVLIGNAAARISPSKSKQEQIETFINTNNHGTHRLIQHIGPLMSPGGHFIIVASSFGSLNHLKKDDDAPTEDLRNKFDTNTRSLDDIDNTMREYTQLVLDGKDTDVGYPNWMNIPSKIGQVASMKIFAAEEAHKNIDNKNLNVYAVCPGLVDTDASRPWFDDMSHAQSPDEATVDILWLLDQQHQQQHQHQQDESTPTTRHKFHGQLVQHRKIIEWDSKTD